ncbi:MAG TPA: hypothetical protein VMK12_09185, partial [Anaeromyxobacteraceae bacterium]|nr:hypothetical protein [Anaeromyxobacteraceae bacterium]
MESRKTRSRTPSSKSERDKALSMLRARKEGARIALAVSTWAGVSGEGAKYLAHATTAVLELADTLRHSKHGRKPTSRADATVVLQDCLFVV